MPSDAHIRSRLLRFGKLTILAGTAAFLASSADYVTVVVLPVDGGWPAH